MITATIHQKIGHVASAQARRCTLLPLVSRSLLHTQAGGQAALRAASTAAAAAVPSAHSSSRTASAKLWAAGALLLATSAFALRREEAQAQPAAAALDPRRTPVGHSVFSYGNGIFGALGQGDQVSRAVPTLIEGLTEVGPIVQICAAGNHAAALCADGRIYTWGSSVAGVLGHEADGIAKIGPAAAVAGVCTQPQLIQSLEGKRIVHLSVSETHAAAVEQLPDGSTTVHSWGTRVVGISQARSVVDPAQVKRSQRGTLDVRSSDVQDNGVNQWRAVLPQPVVGLANEHVVAVACGLAHTLALTADGRVFAFGSDRDGALGVGARPDPTLVQGLPADDPVVGISAGNGSSMFVTASGILYTCGSNDRGQAGTGSAAQRRYLTPVPVSTLRNDRVVQVSSGAFHSLAVDADGSAHSWGLNQSGQGGIGSRDIELRQPRTIGGSLDDVPVASVEGGFGHSGAVTRDGKLFMFGRGREGQLGRGDQVESIAASRDSPVEVTYFSQRKLHVLQCAAGTDFTLALIQEPAQQTATKR